MPSGSATTDEARHSRVQWSTLLLQQLVRIRLCNKYNWCPHLAEPSLPNDWHHLEKSVLVAFGQHAVLEGAWLPSPDVDGHQARLRPCSRQEACAAHAAQARILERCDDRLDIAALLSLHADDVHVVVDEVESAPRLSIDATA